MSIEALRWVFESAPESSPSKRLVLLSLANHANESMGNAWPSVATIMAETSLGRTAVKSALRELREEGTIEETGKRHRCPVYRIANERVVSRPRKGRLATPNRPEPRESSSELSPARPIEWSPTWDAVVEFFGEPQTKAERGDLANTVRVLLEPLAGLSREQIREEVRRRRAAYWPGLTVSHRALRTQWSTLGERAAAEQTPAYYDRLPDGATF